MPQVASPLHEVPEIIGVRHYLAAKGLSLPEHPADIQEDWSLPFVRWVVEHTTSGLEARLQPDDAPGIRICTHRDIVCDPALYNLARVEAGRPTTHIVLGSNLAQLTWVKEVMEANKALFIDRTLSGRAALQQQIELSGRIADIVSRGGHVWIAQGPGRAKAGRDETHGGLLRMLGLAWGGEEKGARALEGLVRPVVIRYDVNPSDALLVREHVSGIKGQRDDIESMKLGLEGWKGMVRMAEGPTVPTDFPEDKEGWNLMAAEIDRRMGSAGLSGQWASEAAAALDGDAFDALSEGFVQRMTEVRGQLEGWSIEVGQDELARTLCKVYREVNSLDAPDQD